MALKKHWKHKRSQCILYKQYYANKKEEICRVSSINNGHFSHYAATQHSTSINHSTDVTFKRMHMQETTDTASKVLLSCHLQRQWLSYHAAAWTWPDRTRSHCMHIGVTCESRGWHLALTEQRGTVSLTALTIGLPGREEHFCLFTVNLSI